MTHKQSDPAVTNLQKLNYLTFTVPYFRATAKSHLHLRTPQIHNIHDPLAATMPQHGDPPLRNLNQNHGGHEQVPSGTPLRFFASN